ncbi:sugar transferase [Rhizobium sp. CCGE532]|uniref:sugar transferase n=1 Tax=unclassified Rhizobium TaxID=2613769 RepID=UPI0026856962
MFTVVQNQDAPDQFAPGLATSGKSHSSDIVSSRIQADLTRRRWHFACKRAMDISISAAALLILAPLLVVIALAIRLESKGSPLFAQMRWGKNGKKIRVLKFRSMRTELGDPTGVAQTVRGDPRITKVGAFLRRTNLDELPQIWNVLRGDMSLVGPRCHAIGMLAGGMLYEELVVEYHKRHAVRPGLTGLAQMRGLRGPTDRPAKARARIASDLFYIENFSIGLDIKILFGTLLSELRGGQGF